jgi:hypothetical protein
MEMARSMMKPKHLTNEYWTQAISCAAYIMNRCPTKSVINMIPKEAWTGTKHNVIHMRVFGCVAYAHVPKQLRKKLDNKGEKCIFVRYSEESKAYKLYNPTTRKVLISRDVQFVEDEAWDGSIEKIVNISTSVSQLENENSVPSNIQGIITPPTPIQAQPSGPQVTPASSIRAASHSQTNSPNRLQQTPSTAGPSGPQSTSSSDQSNPTLTSLRRQKIRSSRDIYEQNDDENDSDHISLFAFYSQGDDPIHFEEAVKDDKWVRAMDEEIDAIEKNQTWQLVSLPKDKDVIGVKWVYKTKLNEKDEV